jgi:hypothetical protein
MSLATRLSQQLSDLFAYLLVPGLAVITPASLSRWVLRKVSAWRWMMAAHADAAFQAAVKFVDIDDEQQWKSRWKQVELLDVRDLYMMLCGRSRPVLDEIDSDVPLEVVRDRVMIGMHWGPSISILKMLDVSGLGPAFPYRPPEKQVLRIRPFFYLFSSMAARYMVNVMGERAVRVGGASPRLRAMLDQPGSIVVLMDAPPMQGRPSAVAPVLGRDARFNTGFPSSLCEKHKEYFFYALSLSPGDTIRKKLELKGPFSTEDTQAFLKNYAAFLDDHLATDSAQWRIWHASQQFWL